MAIGPDGAIWFAAPRANSIIRHLPEGALR
jgi:hypothetical protein